MMAKRLISFALCAIALCGMLCGCTVRRGLDDGYILTAIGFDYNNGSYQTFCELTVIPDRQDAPIEATVYTAKGETPQTALYNLSLNFQKAVYFDHCAALLIGGGVQGAALGNVLSYCTGAENINPTLYTVYCEDINGLLNTTTSAAAVGYHIMNLLQFRTRESGIDFKSKLYQIATEKGEVTQIFTLPALKGGDEITLDSTVVFKDKKAVTRLNGDEYIAYMLLTERFKKGRISIGSDYADIKKTRYDFSVRYSNDTVDADLDVMLRIKDKSKNFEGVIKAQMQSLVDTFRDQGLLLLEERARDRGIDISYPVKERIKIMLEART